MHEKYTYASRGNSPLGSSNTATPTASATGSSISLSSSTSADNNDDGVPLDPTLKSSQDHVQQKLKDSSSSSSSSEEEEKEDEEDDCGDDADDDNDNNDEDDDDDDDDEDDDNLCEDDFKKRVNNYNFLLSRHFIHNHGRLINNDDDEEEEEEEEEDYNEFDSDIDEDINDFSFTKKNNINNNNVNIMKSPQDPFDRPASRLGAPLLNHRSSRDSFTPPSYERLELTATYLTTQNEKLERELETSKQTIQALKLIIASKDEIIKNINTTLRQAGDDQQKSLTRIQILEAVILSKHAKNGNINIRNDDKNGNGNGNDGNGIGIGNNLRFSPSKKLVISKMVEDVSEKPQSRLPISSTSPKLSSLTIDSSTINKSKKTIIKTTTTSITTTETATATTTTTKTTPLSLKTKPENLTTTTTTTSPPTEKNRSLRRTSSLPKKLRKNYCSSESLTSSLPSSKSKPIAITTNDDEKLKIHSGLKPRRRWSIDFGPRIMNEITSRSKIAASDTDLYDDDDDDDDDGEVSLSETTATVAETSHSNTASLNSTLTANTRVNNKKNVSSRASTASLKIRHRPTFIQSFTACHASSIGKNGTEYSPPSTPCSDIGREHEIDQEGVNDIDADENELVIDHNNDNKNDDQIMDASPSSSPPKIQFISKPQLGRSSLPRPNVSKLLSFRGIFRNTFVNAQS
ncbi:hypothetical protein G9A89_011950 [Geosiphon pyriformis]|nr:hypothetical protein G9A89_011950 [Geosiphon pyriformis]